MRLLRTDDELGLHLGKSSHVFSCLADTGFLYALAYDDDRLHDAASDILDLLSEQKITIYINVISRMEFIDLIFRKQVTQGVIQQFNDLDSRSRGTTIFNLLKDIRDKDTAARRLGQSYKVDENRLKRLRKSIEQVSSIGTWRNFCRNHLENFLLNEWSLLENELGLKFVEVLEGGTSELIEIPLNWRDMVELMGEQGLRGPDAMILNLFSKSKFPLLITSDSDFESCLPEIFDSTDKAVYLLS